MRMLEQFQTRGVQTPDALLARIRTLQSTGVIGVVTLTMAPSGATVLNATWPTSPHSLLFMAEWRPVDRA
jgi:hypothetical protein